MDIKDEIDLLEKEIAQLDAINETSLSRQALHTALHRLRPDLLVFAFRIRGRIRRKRECLRARLAFMRMAQERDDVAAAEKVLLLEPYPLRVMELVQ